MKSLITRWNDVPLNPVGMPSRLNSPVQNCLKFSAVLGTTSANSSIMMRPISFNKRNSLCQVIKKNITLYKAKVDFTVFPTVTSKNTTGLEEFLNWP